MSASTTETIDLLRDCEGIQIPEGTPLVLPQGTRVMISQSLGGSYTVITDRGYMVRIEGKDADALGKPVVASTHDANRDKTIEEQVWAQLKTCYDPEIPVDIVELGLVYECHVEQLAPGEYDVAVTMTLTAPGCGMGPVLKSDVEKKVAAIPGVKSSSVEITLDPPWDQSRMSEAAKLQLNMY